MLTPWPKRFAWGILGPGRSTRTPAARHESVVAKNVRYGRDRRDGGRVRVAERDDLRAGRNGHCHARRGGPGRLARPVLISGLDSTQAAGWGTVVGATIAGAAAYGLTEADNPAGVAVTVIAMVVGGLAGLAGEERRQTRRGAEYILRDQDGATIAVVQSLGSGEPIHQPGAEVSLIHGARGYVRVVPVQG